MSVLLLRELLHKEGERQKGKESARETSIPCVHRARARACVRVKPREHFNTQRREPSPTLPPRKKKKKIVSSTVGTTLPVFFPRRHSLTSQLPTHAHAHERAHTRTRTRVHKKTQLGRHVEYDGTSEGFDARYAEELRDFSPDDKKAIHDELAQELHRRRTLFSESRRGVQRRVRTFYENKNTTRLTSGIEV